MTTAGRVLLVGMLIAGVPATAAPTPIPSIGYLADEPTPDSIPVLRAALHERGWVVGRSLAIQSRYAQGKSELHVQQANELVGLGVAVIVAVGASAIEAVRRATKTIPIVMISLDDPVAAGLTGGPAVPGGNLTGLTTFVPELSARRLELLRQAVPGIGRATVLGNFASPSVATDLRATQAAARANQVELSTAEIRKDGDVPEAFARIKEQQPQGLIVLADSLALRHRESIATHARRMRLPAVFALRDFVDAGGLLSYGPAWTDLFRQAAALVDQILRGARLSDLPIARASRVELVINLRTARALTLPMPLSLLRRADRVIE